MFMASGISKTREFLLLLELAQEGSVTNGATL